MNYILAYHWGKRPAQPAPWTTTRGQGVAGTNGNIDGSVVFLCRYPAELAVEHGIEGNLYVYKVPAKVFRASGGWRRFDGATELVISETEWRQVVFLGRSKQEEKHQELIEKHLMRNGLVEEGGRRPRHKRKHEAR